MKKITTLFIMLLAALSFSGCYDRSVLDDKGLNYFMPKAENVQFTRDNNTVTLTWDLPAEIPDVFKRPIAIQIQVVENDIYRDKITLVNEETSRSFTIDPTKKYRCVVKLAGTFTDEAQEAGRSFGVTSEGVVVKIE